MDAEFYRRYAEMTGITPEEAPQIVDEQILECAKKIAVKMAFGYHTPEDIIQEGVYQCMTMLNKNKYDFKRPLQNFLFIHMRNRLGNSMKRKLWFRNEKPCECCDRYNPPENPCVRWKRWHQNNLDRQRVFAPASLAGDAILTREDPPEARLELNDLDQYIKDRLPVELHCEYDLFKNGLLNNERRLAIKFKLQDILEGTPYDPSC